MCTNSSDITKITSCPHHELNAFSMLLQTIYSSWDNWHVQREIILHVYTLSWFAKWIVTVLMQLGSLRGLGVSTMRQLKFQLPMHILSWKGFCQLLLHCLTEFLTCLNCLMCGMYSSSNIGCVYLVAEIPYRLQIWFVLFRISHWWWSSFEI